MQLPVDTNPLGSGGAGCNVKVESCPQSVGSLWLFLLSSPGYVIRALMHPGIRWC